MTIEHFKKCIKAAGFNARKMPRLEVLEIRYDNAPIMNIRFRDVHSITSFKEWFNHAFQEAYNHY